MGKKIDITVTVYDHGRIQLYPATKYELSGRETYSGFVDVTITVDEDELFDQIDPEAFMSFHSIREEIKNGND